MLLQIPGELVMGTQAPLAGAETLLWREIPLNRWLAVAAALLFIINLPNYLHILPHLLKCASMWRRNLSLEHSMQLVRSRNLSCWACLLPFCLIAACYDLAGERIISPAAGTVHTLATMALVAAWALLRQVLYLISGMRARKRQTWQAAHRAGYNFFILLVSVMLLTVGFVLLPGIGRQSARTILLIECGLVYMLFLIRKSQILASEYPLFTTFLYLCALEFLPTGILIWFSL